MARRWPYFRKLFDQVEKLFYCIWWQISQFWVHGNLQHSLENFRVITILQSLTAKTRQLSQSVAFLGYFIGTSQQLQALNQLSLAAWLSLENAEACQTVLNSLIDVTEVQFKRNNLHENQTELLALVFSICLQKILRFDIVCQSILLPSCSEETVPQLIKLFGNRESTSPNDLNCVH